MSKNKYNQVMDEFDEDLGLENLLKKFRAKWYWFLIAVIVCGAFAFYLANSQTPVHVIHSTVLINDPKKGAASSDVQKLGELSTSSGTAVETEAEVLRTRYLMEQVVKEMKLNITYYVKDLLRDKQLYSAPFVVDLVQPADTIYPTTFELNFLPKGKIELTTENLHIMTFYSKPIKIQGVGVIQILKTEKAPDLNADYRFDITSIDQKVEALVAGMTVLVPNKTAAIIDITFNYPVPKLGEDILSNLIHTYVQTNLDNRNRLADSSYAFIQNRLSYLGGELGDLEENIQGFKQQNQITEMSEQSSLLIANNSQLVNELAKVETQLSVVTSLRQYMQRQVSGSSIIPSTIMVSDPLFNTLVEKYNSLLLERDRRLISATETSTVVVNLNKQIVDARNNMLASLNSSINSLQITRNNLSGRIKSAESQVQNVPAKERNYLDLARQQKIKEELFIYLMQKGEETAISKTYNTPNSSNVDPPKAEISPISPKKPVYYLTGVLLGLLIPAGVIYGKFLMNTRIDSREDISKRTHVSVIGEIGHNTNSGNLVVVNKSRSPVAEQFRALRTTLSFLMKQPEDKTILVTSGMPGEGKSFTTVNLGNVLAITGKKVVLVELDLRKPNLSEKLGLSPDFGFTNYVADPDLKTTDILQRLSINENLYLVSAGILPPNPAETLMSHRTSAFLGELRSIFDYIIIDVPPIGVVTDAELLTAFTDLCIYVVRQNHTRKSEIAIVEKMHRNKRMKKLGILVNDIKTTAGSGYHTGYSQNYGTYGK